MVPLAVAIVPFESVTFTVKLNVPMVVGVPEISPVAAFKVSPGGNEPFVIEKVYGGTPPIATAVDVYGKSAIPTGKGANKNNGGVNGLTVMVQVDVPVLPAESTTRGLKV